jgi:predicted RNase H-like nuclease (RuvC/YqgF family)
MEDKTMETGEALEQLELVVQSRIVELDRQIIECEKTYRIAQLAASQRELEKWTGIAGEQSGHRIRLEAELQAARDNEREKNVLVNRLLTMHKEEREALEQQLQAAQAENERLRKKLNVS